MPPPKEDPQTPGDEGHPARARSQGFTRFLRRESGRERTPEPAAPGPVTRLRAAPPALSPGRGEPTKPQRAPADLHRVHPADVHVAVGDHEGAQLAAGPRREGEERQQEQQHSVRGGHGGCGAPAALPRPAAPPPRTELNK